MQWLKLGRLFDPSLLKNRGLSAALMPIAKILDVSNGDVRVYFNPREIHNRSQVYSFDFNINKPEFVTNISEKPLFTHGKLGAFDDAGITLGSIVYAEEKTLLYYTGWNLTVSVPFNNSIGIAEYQNGAFIRYGDGPVMTRVLHEPYSCASPFVLHDDGIFKMWYASMDKWEEKNGELKHFYNIKYAQSSDGINWKRDNVISINYEEDGEYAFGRPFVLKENGIYRMWYSYRGDYYKIGYAESNDGLCWNRKDHISGIKVSDSGWDSEMIEYPFIFDALGDRYMLYNGNGYGKSGIGIAKLEG